VELTNDLSSLRRDEDLVGCIDPRSSFSAPFFFGGSTVSLGMIFKEVALEAERGMERTKTLRSVAGHRRPWRGRQTRGPMPFLWSFRPSINSLRPLSLARTSEERGRGEGQREGRDG
jgi:hypothetical protein